jgi:DNA-binding YbaB/EbfC family protein
MFKELGGMMSLLNNKGKIQEEMQKFQAAVAAMTTEATSGAGYVTVKVNGKMEVQNVRISEEAMALNDREMLEDLMVAATNSAFTKIREMIAAETQKMTANLGLPPGMLGSLGGVPGAG